MNIQREAIYKKRKNALSGERLSVDLNNMFLSLTDNIVQSHKAGGNYDTFKMDSVGLIGFDPKISKEQFEESDADDLVDIYQEQFLQYYDQKSDDISTVLLPIINDVHENQPRYKDILTPFTDGRKNPLPIAANIKNAVESSGKTIVTDIEKAVSLALIDDTWKEHLRSMDELKDSVQSASFEQKDPLVVYKMEAYNLFEGLVNKVNEEVTSYLSKGTLIFSGGTTLEEAKQRQTDFSKTNTNTTERSEDIAARRAAQGVSRRRKPTTFKREERKVGRNQPCPCGSGKKYKRCHGRQVAS